MTNSRRKGAEGERDAAHALTEVYGCPCRRGQQFAGGPDSPDVLGVPGLHFEVKRTEKFSIYKAMAQAIRDAGDRVPVVLHRNNGGEWLHVMRLADTRNYLDAAVAAIDGEPTTADAVNKEVE